MRAIETTVFVTKDGNIKLRAPLRLPPGKHQVLIVVDEAREHQKTARPLPDLASFRKNLRCASYCGNSVAEYRGEERT